MADVLIDTESSVQRMLDDILNLKTDNITQTTPFLFIDLEGVRLSRHGCVAIMQVLAPPSNTVHLVDIHVLKDKAFNTKSSSGVSLKAMFESEEWVKFFFDVRADSDALFGQFGIDLHCVVDLQLMEFATRPGYSRFVTGLSKCIQFDAGLTSAARSEWQYVKEAGRRLFAPEQGGSYEVFLERPLSTGLINYCKQDVLFMPALLLRYGSRMSSSPHIANQVLELSKQRVTLSQSPNFKNNGRHMAVGPHISRYGSAFTKLAYPMTIICSETLTSCCTLKKTENSVPANDINSNLALAVSTLGISVISGSKTMPLKSQQYTPIKHD